MRHGRSFSISRSSRLGPGAPGALRRPGGGAAQRGAVKRTIPAGNGLEPLTDGTPVSACLAIPTLRSLPMPDGAQGMSRRPMARDPRSWAWPIRRARRRPVPHDRVADDGPVHALEGNIRSAGATLVWLGSLLGRHAVELAELAASSTNGINLDPAFGGLGAPWWDDAAVGMLSGSVRYQAAADRPRRARVDRVPGRGYRRGDRRASGPVKTLLADGGPTATAR